MIVRDQAIGKLEDRGTPQRVEEDGYAIFRDVLAAGEIQHLIGELEDSNLPHSRAGVRHLLSHPAIARVAGDPRLLKLARDVLGVDMSPFRATLFDKSTDSNWLITWHQDTALPLREKHETAGWGPWSVKNGVTYAHAPAQVLEQVVALRLHLDDSTEANGPLRVLPGTHMLGVLTDHEVEECVDMIQSVNCLAPKGGVIMMRPLTVHASSKSQSSIPRRVLHIEYTTPSHHATSEVGDCLVSPSDASIPLVPSFLARTCTNSRLKPSCFTAPKALQLV